MRLTKTDNTLIGRVVRYVEHAGDDNLRFSDHWYNNEDERSSIPEIPIGSVGVVVALHYHEGISSCGSTQRDKDEDRWIEVDFGDDKEYFWREELELVYPTPEDAVSSIQTLSTNQNKDGCLLIAGGIIGVVETSDSVAPAMTTARKDDDDLPKYYFATLLNDNGDVDGYFHAPNGLTKQQWDGMATDLECAWGVYSNDCDPSLPVEEIDLPDEEERDSGGWWSSRTTDLINAYRCGPIAFFCHIATMHGNIVHPLGCLPLEARYSSATIHWY